MASALFLSKSEAAKLLGVSLPTINRRLRDGSIPFVKIGARVLVPAEFLSKLAAKAMNEGA